jgi:hypothetical protein
MRPENYAKKINRNLSSLSRTRIKRAIEKPGQQRPRGRHDNLDNLPSIAIGDASKIQRVSAFRVGPFFWPPDTRKRLGMLRQAHTSASSVERKCLIHFKHRTVRPQRMNGAFFSGPAKTQGSSLSQFAFRPAGAETGRSSWKYSFPL